jgi:peptide/nickel transport system permease protein
MAGFLIRRTLISAALLLAFSFLSFSLFASRFAPLRGHPLLPAYWHWLRGVPGGRSLSRGLFGPIWPTLLPSLQHTLILLALTFALVLIFAVAIGTVSAVRRGSPLDGLLRAFTYLAWGVPAFLLALLVQEAINGLGGPHGLGPFPLAGWPGSCPTGFGLDAGIVTPCPAAGTGLNYVVNVLRYLTLPALTLALGFVGLHARYLRSALVLAMTAPHVTTARSKGLSETRVIVRHALRNSLGPFSSALLADFGVVFGAAMVVDWVFQLHGIGSLFITETSPSMPAIDAYAVEALLLVTGLMLLLSSLLGELAVVALDPRVADALR